jgi:hypothetical protein
VSPNEIPEGEDSNECSGFSEWFGSGFFCMARGLEPPLVPTGVDGAEPDCLLVAVDD